MERNLELVAEELFNKIRTQFPQIELGDAAGKVTSNPKEARFFDFNYSKNETTLGRVSVSVSEDDGLVIYYSSDIVSEENTLIKEDWFKFLRELREFAKQRLLNFDTRDITKSNLDKRDYEFLARNAGENNMVESKLFGTSKTSYQDLGEARIIVKHTQPINFDAPNGRTQHIENIYIENAQGERFRYPFKHLNGARALARHVANGGTPYDTIGEHVIGLSEELSKLRNFKNYVDRNETVSESMGTIQTKVLERIEQIKKQIHQLQGQQYYSQFAESFETPTTNEIPEDVVNDWIDRLTVRTFNEELKSVFPFIYKLVGETDIPVKSLTPEDFDSIEELDTQKQVEDELEELSDFEKHMSKLVGEGFDPEEFGGDLDYTFAGDDGEEGQGGISYIAKVVDGRPVVDPSSIRAWVRGDGNNKLTDDWVNDMVKPGGDEHEEALQAAQEDAESQWEERDVDIPAEPAESKENEKDELPPGYVRDKSGAVHSPMSQVRHMARMAMQQAIKKAEKLGAKITDSIKIGEDNYTIYDVMSIAGLNEQQVSEAELQIGDKVKCNKTGRHGKVTSIDNGKVTVDYEDGEQEVGNNDWWTKLNESTSTEIVEFVRSFYDNTTGQFPKGETAIITMVEKRFGPNAAKLAEQIIEKLNSDVTNEHLDRITKLAGL